MIRALLAVAGAYGGVGQAAVHQLHAWGHGPLRLGGRDVERSRRLLAEIDDDGEAVALDIDDPAALDAFCAGARVVLNCAGPSHHVRDRVARAALAAGADCVDAGGDDLVHDLLARSGGVPAQRTVLLSAGLQPGLSALLVRALVDGSEPPLSLTGFGGGLGRFTLGAAGDYLATVTNGAGTPLAAWRDGEPAARALTALHKVLLPYFPARVTAHPYLSSELVRVARRLGLAEASWYGVFDGQHVLRAIERRPATADATALAGAAKALGEAAELDLFGRDPYQLFVLTLEAGAHEQRRTRTLVLHGRDPITLTGAAAALAVDAVLSGVVPTGLGFAGETLDPERALPRLRTCSAVSFVDHVASDMSGGHLAVHEGVL